MQFSGPGWRGEINLGAWVGVRINKVYLILSYLVIWCLDGAWMEVTQESWDLNAGDAGSGWRWDTNLGTWIALRWDLEGAEIQSTRPGWRWGVILMELRRESYDLDWAEMRPEWRWDEHLETWMFIYDAWMELGCNFGDLGRGEAHILKLAWVWDGAQMVLRCNFVDLNGDETSPKWRWNANVRTCIELRHGLDGEMLI